MARHKVELTGVNTANIKVLSNNEMMELFKKYQNGDLSAKEELTNGNLKLVKGLIVGSDVPKTINKKKKVPTQKYKKKYCYSR